MIEQTASQKSQVSHENDAVLIADIDVDEAASIRLALQKLDRSAWFCVVKRHSDGRRDVTVNNRWGGRIDDARLDRFMRFARAMAGLSDVDDQRRSHDAAVVSSLDASTRS